MTRLVNLTPHEIVIHIPDGPPVHLPPSGVVARVETSHWNWAPLEVHDGVTIPVRGAYPRRIEGLPPEEDGVAYVTSAMVADAVRGERYDVYHPDELIRDDEGCVIGCRGLAAR